MTGNATTQGKCTRCRVRYVWPDFSPRVLLRDARCPRCGDGLKQTVYFVNLPICELADPRELLRKAAP
ncbi:MAG TPA: hypothetical protein VJ437_13100 [Acidiferrobacterales bacterium]|nr:hypothetical protein [Acidiferrobacterales bacterium]